jgi:CheY-like chemotaxis protein
VRSGRILVVDDDTAWREALGELLADMGYQVTEAADGGRALDALGHERFDAVLLDLRMPGMSGEDVAARLPKDAPPVVFLTGAPVERLGAALGTGPHYYLPKEAGRAELSLLLDSLDR